MPSDKKVKFIRKGGRIIPIRAKGNGKDKLPPVKKVFKSKTTRRLITAGFGLAGGFLLGRNRAGITSMQKIARFATGGIIGTLVGSSISQTGKTKIAKGESREDARVRAALGNKIFLKAKKEMRKKKR